MLKCSLDKLNDVLSALGKKAALYVPADAENGAKYVRRSEGTKLSDKLNTAVSAKGFFFPQTENLVGFKTTGKEIEIKDVRNEAEDFILFGVRACDVRSFDILDRVFLNDTPDSYYQSRREHGIIISMACDRPAETCFCKAFGIDPAEPRGDIVCYKNDSEIFLSPKTEKGKALAAALEGVCLSCSEDSADGVKALINERTQKLPLASLTTEGFGADKTKELFDSSKWKELSESCLGCGICTFVCPTCQCYDIKDFDTGREVCRFRCWDSCMYSEFTKMSAGQPRLTQLERFRQRFMHKLVYYPDNNDGVFSCVGCGRCLVKCPISMNIVKVMKALGGEQ